MMRLQFVYEKEMLCNNGENKAWFGNFKLQ